MVHLGHVSHFFFLFAAQEEQLKAMAMKHIIPNVFAFFIKSKLIKK